jgi:hypothetical protein
MQWALAGQGWQCSASYDSSKARLQQHCVATEELQRLHGLQVESHHGVVVIDGIVHDEPVGRLLALQDRCAEVLLVLALAAGTEASNA